MSHKVTSPLVLVQDEAGAVQYFYRGATLPAYVSAERIKQLKSDGLIDGPEELAQPNPPAAIMGGAVTPEQAPAARRSKDDK